MCVCDAYILVEKQALRLEGIRKTAELVVYGMS